jgi:methyltransferase (TIGR00027 family)
MLPKKPSYTAMHVASWRATHQLLDDPRVLDDPLALRILGEREARRLRRRTLLEQNPWSGSARAFVAARSRFAEEELSRSLARGVTQYVILGAGLDTFAYRNPYGSALRVFEVDHPMTQAWKRARLAEAGIAVPPTLSYAPTDFEREGLAEGLENAGFSRDAPTFFSWLGVTMYLTLAAFDTTLAFIASTPAGGGVAFDYMLPLASLPFFERMVISLMAHVAAMIGEPFRTQFDPPDVRAHLEGVGLRNVVDLGRCAINDRYFADRRDDLRVLTDQAHVLSAEV